MQRLFPSYRLDAQGRFLPGENTPTLNFTDLKQLLLSKDMSKYAQWTLELMNKETRCRFLDGSVNLAGDRVAFQSMVRSGNTFLRRYLEEITGVFTGADMGIAHTFFEAQFGFLGQNTTCDSNRVWITKTHYPQDIPDGTPFTANKMIVIARNPIDVIPSFFNLVNSQSHSLEFNERIHEDHP